jgi:hypothetical protein
MLEYFDAKSIEGFEVVEMDCLREKYPHKFNSSGQMDYQWFETEIRPFKYIYIRRDKNSLTFNLQNGPVREKGVNGCQIDCIISAVEHMLTEANRSFPCRENAIAITKLQEASMWLKRRTAERVLRGVEGLNQQ